MQAAMVETKTDTQKECCLATLFVLKLKTILLGY
jgi:hypothetical protein